MNSHLHVGLVVNPLAGMGGSIARKGSDGQEIREIAAQLPPGETTRAQERTLRALNALGDARSLMRFSGWAGPMGEDILREAGIESDTVGSVGSSLTSAEDTRAAVRGLLNAGIDLLLFAGGDGTARDVHDVAGSTHPVLGIPAGVKMHSGVFAVSPESAGELVALVARCGLVDVNCREVRDIDEDAFRRDIVRSRYYGELLAPCEGQYLQHTKTGGREDQQLVAAEIAAWQVENMQSDRTYLVGPGSTTAAIMEELGVANTLLGVDVVRGGQLLLADASETELISLLENTPGEASIIVTAIGGQGHLFGRGNQQFSPDVIRKVGIGNIVVVAAKSKLASLDARPLLVDTDDPALDRELCGLIKVNSGYDDHMLYRVSAP